MSVALNHKTVTSLDQLKEALASAGAAGHGIVVGTGYRGAHAPEARPHWLLDISALKSVLEHYQADQVIKVELGMTVSELAKILSAKQQFFPVRVPQDWTLYDVLAFGDAGSLEYGYGSLRDLVLGCDAFLADGTAIKSGGRVVKNVTGYDVTKLIVGSHGSLMVPTAAQLRLYALPAKSLALAWSFDSLWQLMNSANILMRSALPIAALDLAPNTVAGLGARRFVLLAQILGLESVADEVAHQAQSLVGAAESALEGKPSEEKFQMLADAFLKTDSRKILTATAAPMQLPDLIEKIDPQQNWLARPGKGKLYVQCQSPGELAARFAEAARQDSPVYVAHAQDGLAYQVKRLPSDDAAQTELKRRIKRNLDPQGTLNPLVSI